MKYNSLGIKYMRLHEARCSISCFPFLEIEIVEWSVGHFLFHLCRRKDLQVCPPHPGRLWHYFILLFIFTCFKPAGNLVSRSVHGTGVELARMRRDSLLPLWEFVISIIPAKWLVNTGHCHEDQAWKTLKIWSELYSLETLFSISSEWKSQNNLSS